MDTKKHVRELLSVYLDQMCSEEEKKAVEAHLSGCTACRQELEDLRETIKMVTCLKEIEPPDNLWEGIAQRIQKKSFWDIFVWRPVPVVVATMTILFLAVTVNKYTTRVAEQAKTGTRQDVMVGANMPLVMPFAPLKPASPSLGGPASTRDTHFSNRGEPAAASKEKKGAARSEAIMAPSADAVQYKDESASGGAPQESGSLKAVSQTMPSFSTIEMEVQDMQQSMQRLDELAQNHQAERVSQYEDNGALFYQVHQQKLDGFVRDLKKVGKVSQHEAEYERLKVSPAYGGLGASASSQPRLIQIKFNPAK